MYCYLILKLKNYVKKLEIYHRSARLEANKKSQHLQLIRNSNSTSPTDNECFEDEVHLPHKLTKITTQYQQSGESELKMEANIAARKARHQRVFAGVSTLSRLSFTPAAKALQGISDIFKGRKDSGRIVSPTNRLFKVYSVAVAGIFLIGAFNPTNANTLNSYYAPTLEGVEDYYFSNSLLVADQDGYISKINPQTEIGDRTVINGKIVHEVQSGDTLSTIASEYGLKTSTVLWENGLNSNSTIKPGQQILIPPVDGVTHSVEKGQNIEKIASKYKVDSALIAKQNQLAEDAVLTVGQEVYVPGGAPLPEVIIVRNTPSRVATAGRVNAYAPSSAIGSDSASSPAAGKTMVWPTKGSVTQGYRAGHYAIDIADASKPPIWAAASGTVVKVSTGTWGGGYGNHIIIDHGNGLKSLYAHMETVSVSQGQTVSQGQVVGKMGRTGRVYGRTGIHLHFEVHKNGVKQNPGNYF